MSASSPSPVWLRADALGYSYPDQPVFQGLSFAIGPGLSVILGGDGRGKTTLLRLMAGELAATAGVLERKVPSLFAANPRDPADDPLTARQWLARRQAEHPGWDASHEQRLARGFALEAELDKGLFMLSTGTRRKVWLTAALACGAALVLLETPFSALDLPSRRFLGGLIKEAAGSSSQALVVADHALPEELAGAPLTAQIALGD